MPSFVTRLSSGLNRANEHLLLATVPVLFGLLDTNKILAIMSFNGGHIGFKVGLPFSVVTIWQFVSVPDSGVGVNTGLPIELFPFAILTVPVLLVVQATVMAGYFGSLHNALVGAPYDFIQNCRRYFIPFFVLTILPLLILLPLALGVFGIGAVAESLGAGALLLVLPAVVVFVIVAYLFYATPYLIVLRDTGLVDAARQSYTLAMQGGAYFRYSAGFVLFVLLVSPVATALVVNIPLVGLPLGIVGGGFLGLGTNFATMRFFADLDPASSVAITWDGESEGPSH